MLFHQLIVAVLGDQMHANTSREGDVTRVRWDVHHPQIFPSSGPNNLFPSASLEMPSRAGSRVECRPASRQNILGSGFLEKAPTIGLKHGPTDEAGLMEAWQLMKLENHTLLGRCSLARLVPRAPHARGAATRWSDTQRHPARGRWCSVRSRWTRKTRSKGLKKKEERKTSENAQSYSK